MKRLNLAGAWASIAISALFAQSAYSYTMSSESYPPVAGFVGNPVGTLDGGAMDLLWVGVEYRREIGGNPYSAWCIEPLVQDSPTPWTYDVTNLVGSAFLSANVQNALERLWTIAQVETGAPSLSLKATPGPNDVLYASAFQMALWELASDGIAWSFSAGAVQLAGAGVDAFTDNVRALSEHWLRDIFVTNGNGDFVIAPTTLEYLDTPVNPANGEGQDHVRALGGAQVPLPASSVLFGFGAAALAFLRRRRIR